MTVLDTDDVRMLVDLGFLALSRGLDRHADAIFAGVRAVRPDGEAGHLGGALTRLYRGDVDGAAKVLRAMPPSDAARTYLGLALARSGDAGSARALLQDVAATASDPSFADLARTALGELAL